MDKGHERRRYEARPGFAKVDASNVHEPKGRGEHAYRFENTNSPLGCSKQSAREGVDEKYPRWLKVPRVAIGHVPFEDRPRDKGVDALIATVIEGDNEQRRERNDEDTSAVERPVEVLFHEPSAALSASLASASAFALLASSRRTAASWAARMARKVGCTLRWVSVTAVWAVVPASSTAAVET